MATIILINYCIKSSVFNSLFTTNKQPNMRNNVMIVRISRCRVYSVCVYMLCNTVDVLYIDLIQVCSVIYYITGSVWRPQGVYYVTSTRIRRSLRMVQMCVCVRTPSHVNNARKTRLTTNMLNGPNIQSKLSQNSRACLSVLKMYNKSCVSFKNV